MLDPIRRVVRGQDLRLELGGERAPLGSVSARGYDPIIEASINCRLIVIGFGSYFDTRAVGSTPAVMSHPILVHKGGGISAWPQVVRWTQE